MLRKTSSSMKPTMKGRTPAPPLGGCRNIAHTPHSGAAPRAAGRECPGAAGCAASVRAVPGPQAPAVEQDADHGAAAAAGPLPRRSLLPASAHQQPLGPRAAPDARRWRSARLMLSLAVPRWRSGAFGVKGGGGGRHSSQREHWYQTVSRACCCLANFRSRGRSELAAVQEGNAQPNREVQRRALSLHALSR